MNSAWYAGPKCQTQLQTPNPNERIVTNIFFFMSFAAYNLALINGHITHFVWMHTKM